MTQVRALIGVVLTVGLLAMLEAQQRKFYPDDPLRVDLDTIDISEEPAEIELSDMFDRFGHIASDRSSLKPTTSIPSMMSQIARGLPIVTASSGCRLTN